MPLLKPNQAPLWGFPMPPHPSPRADPPEGTAHAQPRPFLPLTQEGHTGLGALDVFSLHSPLYCSPPLMGS